MDNIKTRIEDLFEELGFEKVKIEGGLLYLYSGCYYKITYLEELRSYVIEYAETYSKAIKNLFEDGDLYPLSMSEDDLIDKLRSDLINYYITS